MKKNLSKLLCIIMALALALSLSGCKELDEMKAVHAVWTEGGNILWNDTEYKQLPSGDGLAPRYEGSDGSIRVTDPDVPVLLSSSLGSYYSVTHNGMFLWDYYDGDAFCRADSYDDILSRMENGIDYTDYCYSYFYYDEEKDVGQYAYYMLADPEKEALEKVLASEPMSQPLDLSETYHSFSLTVRRCSEDMIFMESAAEVIDAEDGYYVLENGDSENVRVWEVPAELESDFDSICSVYLAAQYGEITSAVDTEQFNDAR